MHSEERILANAECGDMEAGYRVLGSQSQQHHFSQRVIHVRDAVHPTRAEFRVDLPTRRTQVARPSPVQRRWSSEPGTRASREMRSTSARASGTKETRRRCQAETACSPGDGREARSGCGNSAKRSRGKAVSSVHGATRNPSPRDGDDGSRVESITDTDATSSTTTGGNEATKYRLVKVLAALDRGVAASDDDRAFVGDLIDDLERAADVPRDASLEKALDGEWRLAYSSTFAGEQPGSQGFTGAPGQGAPGCIARCGVPAPERGVEDVRQRRVPQVAAAGYRRERLRWDTSTSWMGSG